MNDKELEGLERDRAALVLSNGFALLHSENPKQANRLLDSLDRLAAAERELAEARVVMTLLPLDCEFTDACDYKDHSASFDSAMHAAKDWLARNAGQEGKDDEKH